MKGEHMGEIIVLLTKPQADAVSWALDPMHDCWEPGSEEAIDNGHPNGLTLPTLHGLTLTFVPPVHPAVLSDLKYRLTEQWPDMAGMEFDPGLSVENINRPALNAWVAIDKAVSWQKGR